MEAINEFTNQFKQYKIKNRIHLNFRDIRFQPRKHRK